MSGAADPGRARRAMASVDQHLVRRNDDLVLLLTPPFDHTALEPGYIKGYVPGVRENGGQYTHAAVWTAIAFAALGDGDKAAELLAMLNPITHAATPQGVEQYRVEPYVVVGDVYSEAPHVGRGGWTWYTGSAGWLYRAGIEWLLGVRVQGTRLVVEPVHPLRMARVHRGVPVSLRAVRHRRREPRRCLPRGGGARDRRRRARRPHRHSARRRSAEPSGAGRAGS